MRFKYLENEAQLFLARVFIQYVFRRIYGNVKWVQLSALIRFTGLVLGLSACPTAWSWLNRPNEWPVNGVVGKSRCHLV